MIEPSDLPHKNIQYKQLESFMFARNLWEESVALIQQDGPLAQPQGKRTNESPNFRHRQPIAL